MSSTTTMYGIGTMYYICIYQAHIAVPMYEWPRLSIEIHCQKTQY